MKKINLLNKDKIKKNITSFESSHCPLSRDASFDYCFNYFQDFLDKKKLADENNIQLSCLILYSYLASWGMLRNSFLMEKSIKFFEPLIKYFASADCDVWSIDVGDYDDKNIIKLIECYNKIKEILLNGENHQMITLVTKIMLGVFGNVPAFDTYFKNSSGFGTFNEKTLKGINDFYKSNNYSELISHEANRIKTYDYSSGKPSNRSYTKAKIIDTVYFMEGFNNSQQKHEN